MIAQSKQQRIKQKPGLFLLLAKAQGFQVIHYQPNGQSAVFSAGCLPNCQLLGSSDKQVCQQCHNSISQYSDPTMLRFNREVRIDLINKKFIYLPICSNEWEDLKIEDSQKISHLRYSSMLSAATSNQQKQMITNYYHYQVLPTPHPRSLWSLTQQPSSKYFSLLKDNSSSAKIYLLIGDEQPLCLNVPNNELIYSCALQMNFVAVVLRDSESSVLLLYEIGSCECSSIQSHLRVVISQSDPSDKCYSLEFVNQSLTVYQTNKTDACAKQINIDNVMSQTPNIHVTQSSLPLPIQQSNYYMFKSANSSKCIITIDTQTIEITNENKDVKCKTPNVHGLKETTGHYTLKQKNKTFLYSFQSSSIIICTYEQNINKLTTIIIDQSTAISKQIELTLHEGITQMMMKRMQVEGCFASYHTIDKNKRIFTNKICII